MSIKYIISKIVKKLHFPAEKKVEMHSTARICSGSHVVNTKIGKYSYIGNFCTILSTNIGNFCSIADNVIIGGASHPLNWVSTSPVFHEGKNIMNKNFSYHKYQTSKKTIIGNDVWIGNNAIIKSGVKISDGAVIGMGSIVTKDVGPFEIWAGNPATLIKKRFSSEEINQILNIEWWNWSDEKIQEYSPAIHNINEFLEKRKDI